MMESWRLLIPSVLLLVSCGSDQPPRAANANPEAVSEIKTQQIQPEDDEIREEWVRVTESDVLSVDVTLTSDERCPWQVAVPVMEFLRVEPLESELVEAVTAALAAVPGVAAAHREGREVWIVAGDSDGPSLVRAAGAVLDRFASRARAELDRLSGK